MRTFVCLLVLLVWCVPARAALRSGDFEQWGLLAIQDEGRRKPLDTYAREVLLRLTGGGFLGSATYRDAAGRLWEPDDFLLSVLLDDTRDWTREPLLLVNFRPLARSLGLDPERKRFSLQELEGAAALTRIGSEVHALRLRTTDPVLSKEQQEAETVLTRMALLRQLLAGSRMLIVPPPEGRGDGADTAWLSPPDASAAYGEANFAPATAGLRGVAKAYLASDGFNLGVNARELRRVLRSLNPAKYPDEPALERERFYNHLGAFPWAALLYAGAAALLAAGGAARTGLRRGLRFAGLGLGLTGLCLHGSGIILRCLVAGRPPVTNMYESVIWVAFVVAALGFLFFWRYRATTYLLAALPAGAVVLLLVQNLPVAISGAIEPLQPVLRDNFWLATHVLTETASYGAFALGMAFGHLLLARYIIDPVAARADHALHFWLYRVLQLGVLLITVGTIGGGAGVGQLQLGPLLGLGPQGDVGVHHAVVLHRGHPRADRGLVGAVRPGGGQRGVFRGGGDGVVRGQLRVGQGAAQLRARGRRGGLRRGLPGPRHPFPGRCLLEAIPEPEERHAHRLGVRRLNHDSANPSTRQPVRLRMFHRQICLVFPGELQ